MIVRLLDLIFGNGGSAIRKIAEVFRVNAEAVDRRDAEFAHAALAQFAAEFGLTRRSWFDVLMDGVNRVPRPALALGTLGLFVAAMVDPEWFAARMQGVALVPEPLWWLLGIIVSFYFGARHQMKSIQFQKSLAATLARAPQVAANIALLERGKDGEPGVTSGNPALDDWRRARHG